jgi:DNA-directed RNA polymerase specialized sigma24 family protein
LNSPQNQGITTLPGRPMESGRARVSSATAGQQAMPVNAANDDPEKARRFRDAALPYLDDVYTLARYLLREPADAEDAVQECYLRALKHFDSYRGPAMKPWLLAILRNVCRAEFARRAGSSTGARRRSGGCRANAAVARGPGNAGGADTAPARRDRDPAAGECARRTVPGDLRAA